MNFATLFVRRPVATTLIQLALDPVRHHRLSRAAGERPADHRLPDDPGERQPAGRQPRHDGGGRRDAAREAVLDDSRRQPDHLDEQHGQHVDHAAVRARSQHRRRRAGRADRDLALDAPAAAGHARAAVVQQGQSRRPADLLPGDELADAAALAGRRVRGDDARAAHLDGGRRGAGQRVRRAEVRRAHRPRSDAAGLAPDRRRPGLDGDPERHGQPADGHALRPRQELHGLRGKRPAVLGQGIRSAHRRLLGRPAGAPRGDRARLRRRRERQDRELGRRHARDLPVGPAAAGHEHGRGRRRHQGAAARRCRRSCRRRCQLAIRVGPVEVDSRVGARRQVHAGADRRARRSWSSSSS